MKRKFLDKCLEKLRPFLEIDSNKFRLLIFFDAILSWASLKIIISFAENRETNVLKAFSAILVLVVLMCLFFAIMKLVKDYLGNIAYTYGNLYLFRKYNFLYESLIGVSLSFLLAISSSLLSLIGITDESAVNSAKICLTAITCIATGTKATLSYTYIIWDTEHKKAGDALSDQPSKEKKQ